MYMYSLFITLVLGSALFWPEKEILPLAFLTDFYFAYFFFPRCEFVA